jgi:hypothetical protein
MTTNLKLLLPTLLFAATAAPSLARAATQADDDDSTTVTATPTAEVPAGVSKDPNVDRAFLLPTAMTQPGGSGTYNNYELVLHGFTYGITDRVQTTVTVLSPITKDMPFAGLAAVKWRLVATPRFHFAVQGSGGVGHESSTGTTLGGGAFASLCLREDCSSLLSASATYQRFFGAATGGSMILYGGSIVHGVSQHVKLLGEVTSLATTRVGGSSGFDNVPGAIVSYGVRLHTDNLAGDIGFIRPVGEDTGDLLMGLPFVNVSYRWQ